MNGARHMQQVSINKPHKYLLNQKLIFPTTIGTYLRVFVIFFFFNLESREKDSFHFLVHSLNTHNKPGWTRPQLAAGISIQISHIAGRNSNPLDRPLLPARIYIHRSWRREQKQAWIQVLPYRTRCLNWHLNHEARCLSLKVCDYKMGSCNDDLYLCFS